MFLIQFLGGFVRVLVILNQMKSSDKVMLSPSQMCLPLHMELLGGLSSTLLLPLFLFWSRVTICCILIMKIHICLSSDQVIVHLLPAVSGLQPVVDVLLLILDVQIV